MMTLGIWVLLSWDFGDMDVMGIVIRILNVITLFVRT